MKSLNVVTTIIIFTLLLSACTGSNSADAADLEGITWVLINLNGSEPLVGHHPTLQFEGDQVSGNTGCNHYGGSYIVEGDSIRFDNLFNTEMACLEPEGVMEQEQLYLELLRKANRFELSEGDLVIFIGQQPVLRLSRE